MRNLFLLIGIVFTIHTSNAQNDAIVISKTNKAITLDGIINEEAWAHAGKINLVQQTPNYGMESTEETDFRILYDDNFIYVGAKNFSEKSTNIREFSKQRDGSGPMDWIGFAFDGYNDRANGLAFATSPAGNRWDAAILVNSMGINLDTNWNTYWEVKTTKDEKGWYAEFKIPISSLRFKSGSGDVVMRFIAWRKIAYKNEFSVFPDFEPDWGVMSFANISMGQEIVFKGIESQKPIYISPYTLGGVSNNKTKNQNERYEDNIDTQYNFGVDLKYAISSKLTLDATINTDFAQAEVDNFQVNLTRASLFFPEKREFFLERTNNFSFNFEKNNDVFYSRRIGLSSNDEVEKIYAGVKLAGRMEKWDLGLLSMQLEDLDNGGSKNLSLLRIKRQIGTTNGYYGGILTTDLGSDGRSNISYGLDAQLEFAPNNFIKTAIAKTDNKSQNSNSLGSRNNMRYNLRIENSNEKGFKYSVSHSLVGDEYNPSMGFEERTNIVNYNTRIGYGVFPTNGKRVFSHFIGAGYSQYDGYISKDKESVISYLGYDLKWKNSSGFGITTFYREEILNAPLYLSSDVKIDQGSYFFKGLDLNYNTVNNKSFFGLINFTYGEFYDGDQKSVNMIAVWDASKVAQLSLNYRFDNIQFDNNNDFINHLVSLNSLYTFTTKHSISTLFQYDDINKRIGTNIRFRFNPKEGNDLFLAITNINNVNRFRESLALPFIQSWQFILKYRHTFTL